MICVHVLYARRASRHMYKTSICKCSASLACGLVEGTSMRQVQRESRDGLRIVRIIVCVHVLHARRASRHMYNGRTSDKSSRICGICLVMLKSGTHRDLCACSYARRASRHIYKT